jgi:large subunit ribosomal protein L18
MPSISHKITKKKRRAARTRSRIHGTAKCPRLSVFRSGKYTYVQLIDDNNGKTLVSASTKGATSKKTPKTEESSALGKVIAEKAKQAGISSCVFDKGPYKYHGRVKAVADGARKSGLKI